MIQRFLPTAKKARHGNGVHVVTAMARRDKIVACFDELIKEKGEKAVLYRKSVKTAMKPPWLQGWRPRVITIPR